MVGLCEMGYKECFNTTLYCFKKSNKYEGHGNKKRVGKKKQRIEGNEEEDLGKMLKLQEQIEFEQCKGGIIRSKAKYVVEGERSTTFFFLEKNRQKADLIEEVVDEHGEKKKGTE